MSLIGWGKAALLTSVHRGRYGRKGFDLQAGMSYSSAKPIKMLMKTPDKDRIGSNWTGGMY